MGPSLGGAAASATAPSTRVCEELPPAPALTAGASPTAGGARGSSDAAGHRGVGQHLEVIVQRVSNQNPALEQVRDFPLNNFKLFSWKPHTGEVSVLRRERALLPRQTRGGSGPQEGGPRGGCANWARALGLPTWPRWDWQSLGPRRSQAAARAMLQDPRGVDGRDHAPRGGGSCLEPPPSGSLQAPDLKAPEHSSPKGKLCRPGPRMCPKVGHLRLPPPPRPHSQCRDPKGTYENLPQARPPAACLVPMASE